VVFVHDKSAEEKFLAEGEGVKRFPVMYNDFVLIGPKDDPASIKGMKDVAKAFQIIKGKQACFVSRGDRSGTHVAELNLWKAADADIEKDRGPWYKSIGQDMEATPRTRATVVSSRGLSADLSAPKDLWRVHECRQRHLALSWNSRRLTNGNTPLHVPFGTLTLSSVQEEPYSGRPGSGG
jgi:hypothetical protein